MIGSTDVSHPCRYGFFQAGNPLVIFGSFPYRHGPILSCGSTMRLQTKIALEWTVYVIPNQFLPRGMSLHVRKGSRQVISVLLVPLMNCYVGVALSVIPRIQHNRIWQADRSWRPNLLTISLQSVTNSTESWLLCRHQLNGYNMWQILFNCSDADGKLLI